MKQEPGRRQPGIPSLKGGEDVKEIEPFTPGREWAKQIEEAGDE